MRALRILALFACAAPLVADAAPARVVVDASALPDSARPALAGLQRHGGVELVSPSPAELPQRDAVLAAARRSYGQMAFRRAIG